MQCVPLTPPVPRVVRVTTWQAVLLVLRHAQLISAPLVLTPTIASTAAPATSPPVTKKVANLTVELPTASPAPLLLHVAHALLPTPPPLLQLHAF